MTMTTNQSKTKFCPECHTPLKVIEDHTRAETICKNCGLVLRGPPVCGIVYPAIIVLSSHHGEYT